jgi:hypothetical protein
MAILSVPWDIRGIWGVLTIMAKVYFCGLLCSVAYSAWFLWRTVLWAHKRRERGNEPSDFGPYVSELTGRIDHVRQFNVSLFVLFGIVFTNEAFASIRAYRLSFLSLAGETIESFGPLVAFGFVVFVLFAFLHILQWTVASRLRSR